MTHLGIEYKTLPTKDEFNHLNNQFSHAAPITQTNYCFDSESFDMKTNRMSLCIRTLPNRAEITLKIPKGVGNLEYNYNLSATDAEEIIRSGEFPDVGFLKLIKESGAEFSSLKSFGSLTTAHRKAMTKIGLMALDSNQYTGTKGYELELEIENAEQGRKGFGNFLAEYATDFKYTKSKVTRFGATLKRV